MQLFRRAAFRAVSAQPSRLTVRSRPLQTRLQQRRCLPQQLNLIPQRRWASGETSPAAASTTDETIAEPPSEAEVEAEATATLEPAGAEATAPQQAPEPSELEEPVEQSRFTEPQISAEPAAAERPDEAGLQQTQAAAQMPEQQPSSGLLDRPPSKKLFVANLYFGVTEETLLRIFEPFGEITTCRILLDGRGLSRGYGHIEFSDLESATRAKDVLHYQIVEGRPMIVAYHQTRASTQGNVPIMPQPPSKSLYVGNMPYNMTDKDFNDLFRPLRNVLDVRVAIDRKTGRARGFAHADFVDVESAAKAKEQLSDQEIYGRKLRVDFSSSSNAYGKLG